MLVSVEPTLSKPFAGALRRARAGWHALIGGTLVIVAACSGDETGMSDLNTARAAGSGAPAAGSAADPAANGGPTEPGDAAAAGSSAGSGGRSGATGTRNRAGSGAPPRGLAGSSGGDVTEGEVEDEDAGVAVEEDDAGLDTPTDAVDAAVADAGPEAPVGQAEPGQRGPNEVALVQNVGVGLESPRTDGDLPGSNACAEVAAVFGAESPAAGNFGDVPEATNSELYTLYHPAKFDDGALYPLLIWGNGTCQLPQAYATLLEHVASHGFIVIAPNSRYVDALTDPMSRALDWALLQNDDPTSVLFGKIDPARIGVFGHAQGANAAAELASDQRVRVLVALNGAVDVSYKPVLFITSDEDIDPEAIRTGYDLTPAPAAFIRFHNVTPGGEYPGHFTVSAQPERVVGPVTAWLRARLLEDELAAQWFSGATCTLCSSPADYEFAAKNLD